MIWSATYNVNIIKKRALIQNSQSRTTSCIDYNNRTCSLGIFLTEMRNCPKHSGGLIYFYARAVQCRSVL
ncbi:hypothetical protein RclHR1_00330044 [Rhizophagus clarus]|uniref:Uncharacterized protein n=1 Tax=Rhizophagus clarus TaxID=94130 RepID=A0A2Z6R8P7_9GLOM|nr:hypothetical protein RclHR1_00330044 [Rhizophagus clarus]